MASLCHDVSKKVACMVLEKQNTNHDTGLFLSHLEDILDLPDLFENVQEAWSHL